MLFQRVSVSVWSLTVTKAATDYGTSNTTTGPTNPTGNDTTATSFRATNAAQRTSATIDRIRNAS